MKLANIYNYQEFHLEPQYPTIKLSYKGWQLISFKQPLKKEEYKYIITLSYQLSFKQKIQEIIEPQGRISPKNLLSFEVFIPDYYLENRNIWFKLCWQAAKAFIDSAQTDFQENGIWIEALEILEQSPIIRYKLQNETFEISINDISWVNIYHTKENPFNWRPRYEIELKSGEIIKLEVEQIAEAYPLDFSKVYKYNRVINVMSELDNICLDNLRFNDSRMNVDIFLFDSSKATQEVAYSLRVDWDGCNGIKFDNQNYQDLKSVAALFKTEYCQVGENCKIPDKRDERHLLYIERFSFLLETKAFPAPQIDDWYNLRYDSYSNFFFEELTN